MTVQLVTPPTIEPVTWGEVLAHLGINDVDEAVNESSIEDINRLIKAVRVHLEQSVLNRALITQTWNVFYDYFPGCNYIELPYPLLQSITHVKYTNSAGTITTLTAVTDYLEDIVSEPGRVVLPYSGSWPTFTPYPIRPIEIQFIAGYGSTEDSVPAEIRQAMLIMISDLYENHEDKVEKALTNLGTVDSLLANYRMFHF